MKIFLVLRFFHVFSSILNINIGSLEVLRLEIRL